MTDRASHESFYGPRNLNDNPYGVPMTDKHEELLRQMKDQTCYFHLCYAMAHIYSLPERQEIVTFINELQHDEKKVHKMRQDKEDPPHLKNVMIDTGLVLAGIQKIMGEEHREMVMNSCNKAYTVVAFRTAAAAFMGPPDRSLRSFSFRTASR